MLVVFIACVVFLITHFSVRLRVMLLDMTMTAADIQILADKISNNTVQFQNVQMSDKARKAYELLKLNSSGSRGAYSN